jgi:hypothetical protein
MSTFKTCVKLVSLVALLATAMLKPGFATGAVAGATEPTQIMNNGELMASVSQQIKTVKTLADSYIIQYKELQQAILAGLPLDPRQVMRTVQEVQAEIQSLKNYTASLEAAGASVGQLKADMEGRFVEAKLGKMTFPQYVSAETERIKKGDARAKQRLDAEQALMVKANADMDFASDQASKISSSDGVHASAQQLNTQMNKLIQQNARISTILAHTAGSTEQYMMNKDLNERKEALVYTREVNNARNEATNSRLSEIQSMKIVPAFK